VATLAAPPRLPAHFAHLAESRQTLDLHDPASGKLRKFRRSKRWSKPLRTPSLIQPYLRHSSHAAEEILLNSSCAYLPLKTDMVFLDWPHFLSSLIPISTARLFNDKRMGTDILAIGRSGSQIEQNRTERPPRGPFQIESFGMERPGGVQKNVGCECFDCLGKKHRQAEMERAPAASVVRFHSESCECFLTFLSIPCTRTLLLLCVFLKV
jgi:hypothetical protein